MKKILYLTGLFFLLFSCAKDDEGLYDTTNYAAFYDASKYVPESYEGENYAEYADNPFILVSEQEVSTFSIDADGGSYANVRRFIESGQLPPKDAVRVEEFINYFPLQYSEPTQHPIYSEGEISECPWTEGNKLIRIGIKGKTIPDDELPPSNFVLLVDVSGSMSVDNKLPLIQSSLRLFVDKMTADDKIALVTYAGADRLVLNSTSGSEKQKIYNAINELASGGGTAGAQGINTAYEIAAQNFIAGGNNRIILASDGDFNVGLSSVEELTTLIEQKRDDGIFITVIGVGQGNYNDAMMEQIANNGNGNYEYLDNIDAGKKLFVDEFSKFFTVAKDIKVQIKFNPETVHSYRLIGYENRVLDNEDFEDDKKDAGEIGAGQNVTALYEIVPALSQKKVKSAFSIDIRYKNPDEDVSIEFTTNINDSENSFAQASENMRFVSSVAGFGMILRESPYKGDTSFDKVIEWAGNAKNYDPNGYRGEFIELVNKAKSIQ